MIWETKKLKKKTQIASITESKQKLLFLPLAIASEKARKYIFFKHGGLNLSRRGLNRDSWSRRQKSISLDVMDNLDGFQKLVSTIEKTQSRSRFLDLVLMSLAKTILFGRDQDFLRLVKTFVIFLDFSIFFSISIKK
jgi:hypothetical protein